MIAERELAASTEGVIGLLNASKSFGVVTALKSATFSLRGGEVLALLGENGAGKSTCVKMLAGVYEPTTGTVVLNGKPVSLRSPSEARDAGIAVMHQHPGLFPDLSIAENIFLGHMATGPLGSIAPEKMERDAVEWIEAVGLRHSPSEKVRNLRISEQQLVEVAKALSQDARVLIMDEPTAALSQREVETLFKVVETLRRRGVAMMFVGHRMDEIFRIADRIAVLRDGQLIAVESAASLGRDRAISMMVGRELSTLYPEHGAAVGEVVLTTKGLTRPGEFEGIDLEVRAGEVVGIGGLVGSGRTELARVLFGVTQPTRGTIELKGAKVAFKSPADAVRAGVAYVSEDRLGQSLVMDFSILENASLSILDKTTRSGLNSRSKAMELTHGELQRMRLKHRDVDQPVKELSGGNQQKVVLAKWLATKPDLLILDEPTQGIDVQAKAEVHAMIAELARNGLAIIVISSELPELLGVSDRIVVLREGQKTGEFPAKEATQEKVLHAATQGPSPVASALTTEDALAAPTSGWLRRMTAQREFGLVIAIAAILLPVSIINPRVFGVDNITAVAMDVALLAIVALAQMFVLVTRNIDLSVASIIGLSAYAAARTLELYPDVGILGGVAVACLVGAAAGLVNGLLVAYGRLPAIVATLGTLFIYRGMNAISAGGHQISADVVPEGWLRMTTTRIVGVPLIVVIAAVVLAIGAFVLNRTSFGRELFASGSNPDGARLIGIAVDRRVVSAFTIAGILTGLCGALWASRYATVDARVASGFELTVIAAVVVGGVAIRGGAGTIKGIVLGSITLLIIRNGLTLVRVDPLWLQGIYGLVIIAAIGVDAAVNRRGAAANH
ncbi:ATP-binding cassette domain-containing protein [Rhizobium mongolense]|uniref:Rhamnose transport system ATP-binding protein n=2 Tax=Rhizobium mongolense TaxID=57676 RepID=A0ABR6IK26_9HYPH|nr:ATP-binding cassette domain-containing protein [Rhizobium mongolense]MBB4227988.1 rhamnose transport system ATP-binding protein [Rhizobium mongolense]TVZ64860.1 rhamnose transport system ATP-binding protein [Rhizobium mongolense USDA 1844]